MNNAEEKEYMIPGIKKALYITGNRGQGIKQDVVRQVVYVFHPDTLELIGVIDEYAQQIGIATINRRLKRIKK